MKKLLTLTLLLTVSSVFAIKNHWNGDPDKKASIIATANSDEHTYTATASYFWDKMKIDEFTLQYALNQFLARDDEDSYCNIDISDILQQEKDYIKIIPDFIFNIFDGSVKQEIAKQFLKCIFSYQADSYVGVMAYYEKNKKDFGTIALKEYTEYLQPTQKLKLKNK